MRRWAPRLGIGAAGVLMAMAMPVPAWWWLGWVGVAPALLLMAVAPTRREAMFRAWLGGIGFLVTLHYWLIPHMGFFTVPVAAFVGLFWLPLGLVVWAFLGRQGRRRRALWALLVVPGVWVAIEGIRSWEYLGGTWGLWGLSQWQVGPILQTAALGGVWLLSFLLILTNTGLALSLLPEATGRQRAVALTIAGAVPLAMLAYGLSRPEPPVVSEVTVAGIQPGVIDSARERLDAHVDLTLDIAASPQDFVVWGQSSVAYDPRQEPEVDRRLREVAERVGTDVLVNIDARNAEGNIVKEFVRYTPEGLAGSYGKQRLVPFGEYIPLRPLFGWVANVTEAAAQDRARGEELTTMDVAGIRIGPLVSYESTFPDMRRRLARLGADLTVVQGGTWTFQGTWAQPQQASHEAVRAVASGRSAILAQVSGTSAAFDARGRLLTWRPADWQGSYLVDIPISREDTIYVRYGDWALWLAWGIAAVTGMAGIARVLSARGGSSNDR